MYIDAYKCHFINITSNLRSLQRIPDHPEAHLHTPGDEQIPPFAQGGMQIAVQKDIRNYA